MMAIAIVFAAAWLTMGLASATPIAGLPRRRPARPPADDDDDGPDGRGSLSVLLAA